MRVVPDRSENPKRRQNADAASPAGSTTRALAPASSETFSELGAQTLITFVYAKHAQKDRGTRLGAFATSKKSTRGTAAGILNQLYP